MRNSRIVALALSPALALGLAVAPLTVATPAAHAAPAIPDNLPFFPAAQENPSVTVTREDGSPVTGPVHRGDVLLVHGQGFDPHANQGGFPMPVPPGTPNGVWVLYSAFPDQWKPSEGAPAETRTHPHSRMAWVLPDSSLAAIPSFPVDMHRTIAREAQPMNDDGTFTARVVVNPPENVPGNNWGIYVYAAGGSVNAAEEIYVPIEYSPEPGPNTPPTPRHDLQVSAAWLKQATDALRGGIATTGGADYTDAGAATFSRGADQGDGIRRYEGTVNPTAKFNIIDVAVRDPWLEPLGGGLWKVTAEVSKGNVGADEMVRVPLGVIRAGEDPVQIP